MNDLYKIVWSRAQQAWVVVSELAKSSGKKAREKVGRGPALLATLMALACCGQAQAATRIWDGGGADNNWTNLLNWDAAAPVAGDDLQFGGGLRLTPTNNFVANTAFNSLTFNAGAGAFTLSGTAITLNGGVTNNSSNLQTINMLTVLSAGNHTITTNAAGGITIGGAISGAGGLTKTGTGMLNLAGNNTYTGSVLVNQGALRITSNGGWGAAAVGATTTVMAGAALETVTANLASSNRSITINGTGVSNGGAIRNVSGLSSIGGAGAITLGSDARINVDAGKITLGVSGSGNLNLGSFNLTVGSAAIGAAGTVGAIINSTISGTGGITFDGVGGSSFAGGANANTYTGRTTINGGIVDVGRNVNVVVIPGDRVAGTVDLLIGDGIGTDTLRMQLANQIRDSVELQMNAAGTPVFNLNNRSQTIGSLASTNTAASVALGTGTLTVANGNGGTDGSGDSTFAGVISGTGGLAKTRSGTFTLTGANTYTGATTVSQGALNIQNAGALGTTAVGTTVSGGAALQLQGGLTVTGEALTLSGNGVANDGALRSLSGANTWAGAITLGTFDARINADTGSTLALTGTVATNGLLLTVGGAGDTLISGIISGTGSLANDGAGTLTLTNTNTYTGATAVNDGTLLLDFAAGGTSNIINSASALTLGGGTLEVKGGAGEANTQTFAGLSGTGGTVKLTRNGATSLQANLGAIAMGGSYNFVGADTTVAAGLAVPGVASFTTTTAAGANNGLDLLGASLWNGSNWASTATNGSGTTYVVEYLGAFTELVTDGNTANPAPSTLDPVGNLRIRDGGTNGIAATYSANTAVKSLLMVAPTYSTTVAINPGVTLTVGNSDGATGAVAISAPAQSLTLGNVVNQGTITAGTTATASTLALTNLSPTSTLAVNAKIADNGLGGKVDLATRGKVVLRGSNTFTGNTSIGAGLLQIAGTGSLGSGTYAGAIANDGSLQYSSSVNQTFTGAISGVGSLVKDGTGTVVLTGANTYTGDTTIATGILQVAGAGTLGGGLYIGKITNNGALQYSSSADQLLVGAISGSGSLLKNGSGKLTLISTNSYLGDTTIGPGTLRIAGAGSLGNGAYAGSIVNNGTLQYSSSATQLLSGAVSGSGSLLKDGSGTLSLSNSNTYAGSTTVNGGTLLLDFSLGGTNNIITTAQPLSLNGGTLELKGGAGEADTQSFNGLNGSGGALQLTQNGATSINLNVGAIANPLGSAFNFIGGSTTVGGGIATAGNANFITTTTLAIPGFTKLGGSLWNGSGWASTASDGSGTTYVVPWIGTYNGLTTNSYTLGPAATYTNPVGDLRIDDGTAIATAAIYTANTTINSLLMVAPTFATTVAINAGVRLTIDGTGAGTGTLGAVAIGGSGQSLTLGNAVNQGAITAGSTAAASKLILANVNAAATLTANSVIADNAAGGAVSLQTRGQVVVKGTNTYTGSTTIQDGNLQVSTAGSLGSGNYLGDIANNGTLQYSSSTSQILGGSISGTGGITKDGAGALTLTGTNTFDGVTTLSAGVLNIQNSSALGSTLGGTSVAAGTALQLQNNIAVGAEALTLNGTGVGGTGALRNISGNNSWAGPITLGGATRINSDAGTLTLGGALDTASNANPLTVGGAGNTTITGLVSGPASLAKDGTGVLTLSAANTYTGGSTVTAGLLKLTHASAAGSGTVTDNLAAGTVGLDLAFATAGTFGNTLAGTGATQVSGALATVTGANGSYTGGWKVTGTGNLGVANTATTSSPTLGTGSVDIAAGGNVNLQAAGAFSFDNALTGAGTLNASNANQAFSFAASAGSAFTGTVKLTNNSFALSGNNTTTLTAAKLELNAGNVTTVGAGTQTIGGLNINGGAVQFATTDLSQAVATNNITTGTLDVSHAGTVRINLPGTFVVPAPGTPGTNNLLMQDDANVGMKLVSAGAVTGTAGALVLTDQNGTVITNATQKNIQQGSGNPTVATGIYDFRLSTGGAADGLYVNYGLQQLDLQAGQTLTLAQDTGATGI
ncbi:MAG: autotransporter-associated beta strand repeat-containing protein, partial [Rhodoferax sp.]|uniref:autotransporter-associated beta strand repeat-containing protein n=1 Tax=Rhodoferax sp. TaxID=50421 RepID=UPI0032676166